MQIAREFWICGRNIAVGWWICIWLTMVGKVKYVRLSLCYLGPVSSRVRFFAKPKYIKRDIQLLVKLSGLSFQWSVRIILVLQRPACPVLSIMRVLFNAAFISYVPAYVWRDSRIPRFVPDTLKIRKLTVYRYAVGDNWARDVTWFYCIQLFVLSKNVLTAWVHGV